MLPKLPMLPACKTLALISRPRSPDSRPAPFDATLGGPNCTPSPLEDSLSSLPSPVCQQSDPVLRLLDLRFTSTLGPSR
eukprot:1904427-Rhodomonas_salina.1